MGGLREIRSLTSLRGLAALWVVAIHSSEVSGGAWLRNGFVGRGYLAVDVFLILSGFVLARAYGQSAMSLEGYAAFLHRRVFRLFPLHLAVLGAIVLVHPAWPMAKVALEAALMQRWDLFPGVELVGPGKGGLVNGPDWSISCEWALNLAFPVFVLLCLRGRALAVATGGAAAAILAAILMATGTLEVGAPASALGMVRCAADFTLGLLAWRWHSFLTAPRWLDRALSVAPLYFLGEISYSVYLTHWPILWAFGMTWWSAILLAVVPIFSYRLVENPAREFGRRSVPRTTQFFSFGRNPIT